MTNSQQQYKQRHGELLVHSFVEFDNSVESAVNITSILEEETAIRVGTLGLTNVNGQQVGANALEKSLTPKTTVPMFVQHNKKSLPFGKWVKFEVRNSTDVYAVPKINTNTTQGQDLKKALEERDIFATSWTVSANTYDDIEFRKKKRGESAYFNDEVMIVTAGNLVEVSFVTLPADSNTYLSKMKSNERTLSTVEVAIRNLALEQAARRFVIKRNLMKEKI